MDTSTYAHFQLSKKREIKKIMSFLKQNKNGSPVIRRKFHEENKCKKKNNKKFTTIFIPMISFQSNRFQLIYDEPRLTPDFDDKIK